MFDKEWGNKGFSSGTSLPLLLTFGWTFRWDPPSWPSFCKVSAKTGTRRNCKWGCQARKRWKGKRKRTVWSSYGTTAALLFQLFNHTEDKKKKQHEEMCTCRINTCNGEAGIDYHKEQWRQQCEHIANERRTYLDHLVVNGKAASNFHAWKGTISRLSRWKNKF